jgi:hypothetical protein
LIGLFLVICTLTTSGYALSSVEGSQFHIFLVAPILLLISYTVLQKKFSYLLFNTKANLFYISMLLVALMSTLINPSMSNVTAMFKLFILLTFAYLFTSLICVKKFSEYLVVTVSFLALVSVIVYFLVNGLNYNLSLPVYININGLPYKSGFIFFVYDNHMAYRNMGPFWEPGIFGTYLTLALLLLIKSHYKYKKAGLLILSLALITTVSTAAIIFLFLALCFGISAVRLSPRMKNLLFICGISSAVVLFISLIPLLSLLADLMPSYFAKFTATDSPSVIERIASPLTNLKLFAAYPYFGLGLFDSLTEYSKITNASQLSTPTFFLAAFGVGGIIYSLAWLYGVFSQEGVTLLSKIIVFIYVISMLSKEPHYYFSLTYIFLFYLLSSYKKNEQLFNLHNPKSSLNNTGGGK